LKDVSLTDEKTEGSCLHDRPVMIDNTATTKVEPSIVADEIVGERWPRNRPIGISKLISSMAI
jgi:hypothetical protein